MSIFDDVFDCFRNFFPYYLTILLSLFIIISPIDPIKAAQDFTAYRLQQFDIQGARLGSRSSVINLEAKVLHSKVGGRKCLLMKIMEASAASIKLAISQNVGAIIVLMPPKNEWSTTFREYLLNLENELLAEEFIIPIYFTYESDNVKTIYDNVQRLSDGGSSVSAFQVLASNIWSHGYQLYTMYHDNKAINDATLINLYGKLAGNGIEEQLPTILVVAHYDSMGMIPSLSYGYDSNASGLTMLLQLMRLFSRLYSSQKNQGRYNMAFLLTGGGKLNYIGAKKWLEELNENTDIGTSPDKIASVLCLESVAGSGTLDNSQLYLHVSKPPRNTTANYRLYDQLRQLTPLQLVHKRVKLSEEDITWEHERFSLKKIPAMTLSARSAAGKLNSVVDTDASVEQLTRHTRLVAEAVARLVYGVETDNLTAQSNTVSADDWITTESVAADLALATRYPRSPQLMRPGHPLLASLEKTMRHHLGSHLVRVGKVKADPRDPEFALYSGTEATIVAHRVKPAIFDFLVTCIVLSYLGAVFVFINNFFIVSRFVLRLSNGKSNEKYKRIL